MLCTVRGRKFLQMAAARRATVAAPGCRGGSTAVLVVDSLTLLVLPGFVDQGGWGRSPLGFYPPSLSSPLAIGDPQCARRAESPPSSPSSCRHFPPLYPIPLPALPSLSVTATTSAGVGHLVVAPDGSEGASLPLRRSRMPSRHRRREDHHSTVMPCMVYPPLPFFSVGGG